MKHANPIKRLGILAIATAALTLSACSSATDGDPTSADSPTSSPAASSAGADATSSASPEPSAPATTTSGTPITITAGGRTITATLNHSDVSQDFIESLPVTLPWYRNYDIEFITELAAPMTETGPFYTDVQPGDLVYYNPMDSITIIYEETTSVPTLTKMGEVTSDLAIFRSLPDNIKMRIELG
ncbi:cyclophilin-like fold protein [Nocardioides terrigena]|uniref:cyclophilin-like fold protein n=1 Tax=Nocardioides terrigena TaxID=424797 RepID=UPI00131F336A|nr:cyclophilin-like fold protein [Nocardioides terrigena]